MGQATFDLSFFSRYYDQMSQTKILQKLDGSEILHYKGTQYHNDMSANRQRIIDYNQATNGSLSIPYNLRASHGFTFDFWRVLELMQASKIDVKLNLQ